MKHKVKADTLAEFLHIFDALFARLDQTGERIVGARFSFNSLTPFPLCGFRATVWTKRAKEEGGDHA
jgi:hypothetical protein